MLDVAPLFSFPIRLFIFPPILFISCCMETRPFIQFYAGSAPSLSSSFLTSFLPPVSSFLLPLLLLVDLSVSNFSPSVSLCTHTHNINTSAHTNINIVFFALFAVSFSHTSTLSSFLLVWSSSSCLFSLFFPYRKSPLFIFIGKIRPNVCDYISVWMCAYQALLMCVRMCACLFACQCETVQYTYVSHTVIAMWVDQSLCSA